MKTQTLCEFTMAEIVTILTKNASETAKVKGGSVVEFMYTDENLKEIIGARVIFNGSGNPTVS